MLNRVMKLCSDPMNPSSIACCPAAAMAPGPLPGLPAGRYPSKSFCSTRATHSWASSWGSGGVATSTPVAGYRRPHPPLPAPVPRRSLAGQKRRQIGPLLVGDGGDDTTLDRRLWLDGLTEPGIGCGRGNISGGRERLTTRESQ